MNKYEVKPVNGGANATQIIEADRVENDDSTGRLKFFAGDELVASQLNVTFRKLPADAAA
jgi:hypothetical protein